MIKKIVYITLLFVLSGCYFADRLPVKAPVAKAQAKELVMPLICTAHGWRRLEKDKTGQVILPAGSAVKLANEYVYRSPQLGIYGTLSCFPVVSFVPAPGTNYYLNFLLKQGYCQLTVLKMTPQTALGFSVESTAHSDNNPRCDRIPSRPLA